MQGDDAKPASGRASSRLPGNPTVGDHHRGVRVIRPRCPAPQTYFMLYPPNLTVQSKRTYYLRHSQVAGRRYSCGFPITNLREPMSYRQPYYTESGEAYSVSGRIVDADGAGLGGVIAIAVGAYHFCEIPHNHKPA